MARFTQEQKSCGFLVFALWHSLKSARGDTFVEVMQPIVHFFIKKTKTKYFLRECDAFMNSRQDMTHSREEENM